MTVVGTVEQNKAVSAVLFLDGKQIVFFYLCYTNDLTLLSHVPVRNKTVNFFS